MKRYLYACVHRIILHNPRATGDGHVNGCGLDIQWAVIQPQKLKNSDPGYRMMSFEGIMLSALSQAQKDEYYIIPLT